jgi:hypothetical protein
MSEVESSELEPNDFLREEQKREADEAVREIAGVEPIPTPDDPIEEALFQAHMARFPQAGP